MLVLLFSGRDRTIEVGMVMHKGISGKHRVLQGSIQIRFQRTTRKPCRERTTGVYGYSLFESYLFKDVSIENVLPPSIPPLSSATLRTLRT